MSVKTVDIHEHTYGLAELASLAETGTDVVLSDNGKPIARIVPINAPTKKRIAGLHQGAYKISDDIMNPLPDDFWLGSK